MDDQRYGQAIRSVTQFWVWTVPVLFLVLVLLGLTMRANQAGIINVDPDLFYAVMTLHGLGMAGTGFVAGLAGVTYLLARYVRVNLVIAWMMYVLTVLGVVGLVIACLIGRFGPGWYLLYPLPFLANGAWPDWALGLAVLSLIVLGVAWLLGQIDLFRALVARYGLTNATCISDWRWCTRSCRSTQAGLGRPTRSWRCRGIRCSCSCYSPSSIISTWISHSRFRCNTSANWRHI